MTLRPLRADLHVHSTASDGTVTPRELVRLAASVGLTHLALTDHDSVAGIAEALVASADAGVEVIPGVELSAVAPDGSDVHILGYFIDPDSPALLKRLTDLRAARRRRAEAMVESLAGAGIAVTIDDVLRFAEDGAVGRAHVARAIVSRGHAESVADAFDRLIGRGRPHYVAKDVRTPAQAIACISDAGGLAVIAHPGISGHRGLVEELAASGLAGVEAFHADHSDEQRSAYELLARQLGLLVTGGSDYHGPTGPNPALGSVDLPSAHLAALLAARAT